MIDTPSADEASFGRFLKQCAAALKRFTGAELLAVISAAAAGGEMAEEGVKLIAPLIKPESRCWSRCCEAVPSTTLR